MHTWPHINLSRLPICFYCQNHKNRHFSLLQNLCESMPFFYTKKLKIVQIDIVPYAKIMNTLPSQWHIPNTQQRHSVLPLPPPVSNCTPAIGNRGVEWRLFFMQRLWYQRTFWGKSGRFIHSEGRIIFKMTMLNWHISRKLLSTVHHQFSNYYPSFLVMHTVIYQSFTSCFPVLINSLSSILERARDSTISKW